MSHATTPGSLLCVGLGYTARALASRLSALGWQVRGTCQSTEQQASLQAAGFTAEIFTRERPLPKETFAAVTHLLSSVPPEEGGDPVLDRHADDIAAMPNLTWIGYLSTTGVYGNRDGGWVDEESELRPTGERGLRRVRAEAGWLDLCDRQMPVHIFRLAAIYGPGRSPFEALRAGTARRIERRGQVFSRIHVDDLATVLLASMARPRPGAIYNVCDDEPTAPAEVLAYAAALLGLAPPPPLPFEAAELSPMAKSFWDDNKRVSNARIKQELGIALRYPDYRAGLSAILATAPQS